MKNIPKKIYLQVDPENEQPKSFDDLAEITWCRNKINDNDIEYVRSRAASDQLKILSISRANKIYQKIMKQREKICEAFIAEFGCKPSDIEQIEKNNADGTKSWYLRKHQD